MNFAWSWGPKSNRRLIDTCHAGANMWKSRAMRTRMAISSWAPRVRSTGSEMNARSALSGDAPPGVSAVLTTASAFFIFALPKAARRAPAATPGGASPLSALRAFISLPVLRTRGAQLLMAIRVLMALAFHMFAPAWQVSIKRRFDFGPQDHAKF